jgi:hypothetical protein
VVYSVFEQSSPHSRYFPNSSSDPGQHYCRGIREVSPRHKRDLFPALSNTGRKDLRTVKKCYILTTFPVHGTDKLSSLRKCCKISRLIKRFIVPQETPHQY